VILRRSNYNHNSVLVTTLDLKQLYEGWNFNSDNYLFTTDTK